MSNFLAFDDAGRVTGIAGPMIHVFNKSESAVHDSPYFKKLAGRSSVLLLGDSLGDLQMSSGCEGVEALLTESLLAARRYGVDDTVVDSLDNLLPGADWRELSRYMISRSLQHGARRAEEMREVASTLGDAGLESLMSTACEARQAWASAYAEAHEIGNLSDMLDAILTRLESGKERRSEC